MCLLKRYLELPGTFPVAFADVDARFQVASRHSPGGTDEPAYRTQYEPGGKKPGDDRSQETGDAQSNQVPPQDGVSRGESERS